jgi:hypothetical protein
MQLPRQHGCSQQLLVLQCTDWAMTLHAEQRLIVAGTLMSLLSPRHLNVSW